MIEELEEKAEKLESKVKKIENDSFAKELLHGYTRTNKRLFIIWLITFIAFIGLLGYTLWLQNDIGTYEDTITQENETGYNNYIGNNGDITNGKTNN